MKKKIELNELEWRIDYLKSQSSLDEQIREHESELNVDEKAFFDEEIRYLKEWIKKLEDEYRKLAKL